MRENLEFHFKGKLLNSAADRYFKDPPVSDAAPVVGDLLLQGASARRLRKVGALDRLPSSRCRPGIPDTVISVIAVVHLFGSLS